MTGYGCSLRLMFLCLLWTLVSSAFFKHTKTYVPSALELRWLTNISRWQGNPKSHHKLWESGCPAHRQDHAKWDRWTNELKAWTDPNISLSEDIFSYHEVQGPNSSASKLYIEPLASALRSPKFPCEKAHYVFDTSWLVIPFAIQIPHQRMFFFDLGSTFYDAGVAGPKDSLSWFVSSYEAKGWHFTDIFAWEMKPLNHVDYWKRVPERMLPRLHFFNTPCSSDPKDPMNPLRFVKALAKPEDYVVFKLDIDNNEVEVNLVMQILGSTEISDLIDEMFWENHVDKSPMRPYWGDLSNLTGPSRTLAESYQTFFKLRKAGIRAHSWV